LTDTARFGADRLIPIQQSERRIKVQFNADSSDSLPWSFSPQQKEVSVLPGETALAFYTATNNSDEDIIGIATYNVTPNQVRYRSPFTRLFIATDSCITCYNRLLLTLLKLNASVSRNSEFKLTKKSIYPSSSSSIVILWKILL
jgi:hypothetical protein